MPMCGKGMSALETVFSPRPRLPVKHTGRMSAPLLTPALRLHPLSGLALWQTPAIYSGMSTHSSTVCLPVTRAVYLHTLPVAVSILKMPGTRLSAAWEGARYSPLSSTKRPTSGGVFVTSALPNTNGSVQHAAAITSSSVVELFIFFPFHSAFGKSFQPSPQPGRPACKRCINEIDLCVPSFLLPLILDSIGELNSTNGAKYRTPNLPYGLCACTHCHPDRGRAERRGLAVNAKRHSAENRISRLRCASLEMTAATGGCRQDRSRTGAPATLILPGRLSRVIICENPFIQSREL